MSFTSVIQLITNDDWRNMAQCSIIDLSPPTPLKELDLTRPQLAGFFLVKISADWWCVRGRKAGLAATHDAVAG